MKEEIKVKRDALKEMSRAVKMAIDQGAEFNTINEGLVALYREQGHTELHSFNQWLSKGFAVRKGERALLLWGEPRQAGKVEKPEGENEDEYKFFPLAYVFSQKQVDPVKN